MSKTYTVGNYLVDRLEQLGLGHLFSIAGDYSIDWVENYVRSSHIQVIEEVNELNAGYAADGYARLKGVGGPCVTYSRCLIGGQPDCRCLHGAGPGRPDQRHAEHQTDAHLRADGLQFASFH